MAFLFTGTFSEAQIRLLVTWVQQQVPNIDARISHLLAKMRRIGFVKMEFDGEGFPTSYQPMYSGSLMEKLIGAYEAQGGDLARDFRLRMHSQKVSHAKASLRQGGSTQYTDGSLIRSSDMDDTVPGDVVSELKKPFIEALKRKRQLIEHRIKVTQDLYDRLNTEVALLKLAKYQPAGLTLDPGEDANTSADDKAINEAKGEAKEGEAFEETPLFPESSIAVLVSKVDSIIRNSEEFRSVQTTVTHDIFGLKVKPLFGFDSQVDDLGSTPQQPSETTGSFS